MSADVARRGAEIKTAGDAWRDFTRRRSPRLLLLGIALALAARIALGGWSAWDAVAAAAILVIYPFGEWAIHVYLLHARPVRVAGRRFELPTTRAHREHHERPNHLGLILLGPWEVLGLLGLAVPVTVIASGAVVALAGGGFPVGQLTTMLLVGYVLVLVYEWTHFLIHTAHRPRSRLYRQVWRTHRLHHFKNERYWHGITNTVADRVLGTHPDQREVPRSRTARTLDPAR